MAVGLQLRFMTDMLLLLIICFVGEESGGFRKPKRVQGGPPSSAPACVNIWGIDDEECNNWAFQGECKENSDWMRKNCQKACDICIGQPPAPPSDRCFAPEVPTYDPYSRPAFKCIRATVRAHWELIAEITEGKEYEFKVGYSNSVRSSREVLNLSESFGDVIKSGFRAFGNELFVGADAFDVFNSSFRSSGSDPFYRQYRSLNPNGGKFLFQWFWAVDVTGLGTTNIRTDTVQSNKMPLCFPGKEKKSVNDNDNTYQHCWLPSVE